MNVPKIWVPFSVLNSPSHSAGARLVSILLDIRPVGLAPGTGLGKQSGLDPKTIALARARLAEVPLPHCFSRHRASCAAMPITLLTAAQLSAGARLLYGQLQGLPGFAEASGSSTYANLALLTGSTAVTLRRAAAELARTGWLTITQKTRKSPIHFTLCDPVETRWKARVSSMKRKYWSAQYKGETLLREILDVLVAGGTIGPGCFDVICPIFGTEQVPETT